MKEFELIDALIDVCYIESVNAISYEEDLLRAPWFMEDGGGKSNKTFLQRLKDVIISFFHSLKKAWTNLFSSDTFKSAMDTNISQDDKLKLEKFKTNEEIAKESDQTIKKIDDCKTVDEVNREIERYRKKIKAIIAASAVVTISAGAAIVWLKHKNSDLVHEQEKLSKKYCSTIDEYERQISHMEEVNKSIAESRKLSDEFTKAAIDGLQSSLDRAKRKLQSSESDVNKLREELASAKTKAKLEVERERNSAIQKTANEIIESLNRFYD